MSQLQYKIFCYRIVLFIWYWLGRTLGIIPVYFNCAKGRYEIVGGHRFIASSCCALLIIGFPIANYQFFLAINIVADQVKYSFSMVAANLSNLFVYISAILAYDNLIRNVGKHLDFMNKIHGFYQKHKIVNRDESRFPFAMSFLSSILMISAQIFSFICLVDSKKFGKCNLVLLCFPTAIAVLVGNQYLLGTIFIKQISQKINEKVKSLKLPRVYGAFNKYRQFQRINFEL
jgi:hypothetical protein